MLQIESHVQDVANGITRAGCCKLNHTCRMLQMESHVQDVANGITRAGRLQRRFWLKRLKSFKEVDSDGENFSADTLREASKLATFTRM
jgi:hypothetical protein